MNERCVVKKVRRGRVYIELKHSEKCDGCKMCAFNNKSAMVVPAVCELSVKTGDTVIVQMPTRSVGAAALLIYALPLLIMIVGALIGLVGGLWLQVGLAGGGLVLGLACVYPIDRFYRKKSGVLPVVIEVLSDEGQIADTVENNIEEK